MNKPENKAILDVKWVNKRKLGDIFKARLVVQGFQQKDSIDDTYSPVVKMQILKLLLSYSCQYSLNIHQIDVGMVMSYLKCMQNSHKVIVMLPIEFKIKQITMWVKRKPMCLV